MQAYPNNGFISYWTVLRKTSVFRNSKTRFGKFLSFLQTAFRLAGQVIKNAIVELFFLLAFWLVITKMGQGRDLIVSLFEPEGIYTKWRIFFTILSAISLSVSMWIIPAFLFQQRERKNRHRASYRSVFKQHLFFAHRILPLFPFWLLAYVLFNQKGIGYLFAAISLLQLFVIFLFNEKIKTTRQRAWYAAGVFVLLLVEIIYFRSVYKETYTEAKILLTIILYLLAFLAHFIYHEVDIRILKEHEVPDESNTSSFTKYRINSWFYLFCLCVHIVLVVLFFTADKFNVAPESMMLYLFSFYVFMIDLVLYFITVNQKRKTLTFFVLLLVLLVMFLSPNLNLNLRHFSIDRVSDPGFMKGMQRLSFEDKYAVLKSQIEANNTGEPYPIILISGEGGGSRAGMWLSQNLINFDYYTKGKFREHIFSISTVSGSSVGLSTVFSFWEYTDEKPIDTGWVELPSKVYANNFVGSSVAGMMLTDVWKSILPGNWERDRNSVLQDEEAYHTQRACREILEKRIIGPGENIPEKEWLLRRDFMSFFYRREGDSLRFTNRPAVFINTCRSNDGRRGIFSPIKLNSDVFNDAIDIAGYLYEDSLCQSSGEKVCSGRKSSISLGQACNTSELFPLFSAPAYIDSLGSFVDGGYHENSGLKTTLDVYLRLKKQLDFDKMDGKYKIYILYFKNSSGQKNLYKPLKSEAPFTLPIKALSSQPFEGSASYFEEKARFTDRNSTTTQFLIVQLDNTIIKDSSERTATEGDEKKRDIEREILDDLRTESDSVLNFPLARWLSKSVIRRMRIATFPVKINRNEEDLAIVQLLDIILNIHGLTKKELATFRKWSPGADTLIRQQQQLNAPMKRK